MEYLDLVLINGELVRVECPSKHHDELYDSINDAIKRGDWWSPSRFEGCKAEYMGLWVERVAMNKVVGML